MPSLIEVQKHSYDEFLQRYVEQDKRKNNGLQAVFTSTFPIAGPNENVTLEYVSYTLGQPKYTVKECQERDMTYGAPLKIIVRMVIKVGPDIATKKVKEVKEQEIFLCEIPLMTDRGTFIINGAERVIVNQLHRSPGVIFDEDEERSQATGKNFLVARLIPYRGSWLEFEFDSAYALFARIDRRKKIPITQLLRAIGYRTEEEMLKLFFEAEKLNLQEADRKTTVNRILAKPVQVGEKTVAEAGVRLTEELLKSLKEAGVKSVEALMLPEDEKSIDQCLSVTLAKDSIKTEQDAILDIYRKMRPGQPTTVENAKLFFQGLFFNPKKYDLGRVGRFKLNRRLKLEGEKRVLTKADIVGTIRHLLNMMRHNIEKDDIDHLGNRRVRSAGELVENQFRVGLSRMERAIRERLMVTDIEEMMPNLLINTKPAIAAIKEFFGSSQLSQFMDQTNPLAELTHKRRLSALGPGGLNRERAGFEVRDVHHTHYGRMCPIETPEGPNIGLISSLASYARVNELGFIETPYRKVVNGTVRDEVEYLTADMEDPFIIAEANAELDSKGRFKQERISARFQGSFIKVTPEEIHYIDVSPKQLVSVATALIPFLEHDDANRALMGSNMQRQAVPMLRSEAPVVRTGMEERVAIDSGSVVTADRNGMVEYVDAEKIIVVNENGEIDTYPLTKFARTNQDTFVNQRPIVKKYQKVKRGEVIADGPCTDRGLLALGHNLLVAFMPWRGSNFEDAIVISERMLKEDYFTSVHIQEFELEARDTKLGKEEVTRDIPNISEEALKNLDETGVVKVGSEVHADDILIGKIAPKGETELTPEEKFLRAIFGEKARDVRDVSLRATSGVEGKVIDVKIFSRKEREGKAKEGEKRRTIEKNTKAALAKLEVDIEAEIDQVKAESKQKIKEAKGEREKEQVQEQLKKELTWIKEKARVKEAEIELEKKKQTTRLEKGDELPPGVIKLVKVYVAQKRKVSVGDKMAGRHGNKGVVARIVPVEDMPFLEDGTPVDIVLNPLGVPSRMNVGQILETHLGWAAKKLNIQAVTPVFDGAKEHEIKAALKEAGLPENGKTRLMDGVTGESFNEEVTVGYIYMLKLLHLVDDKMHARSIGPYSLVTQQPLGGKAQFGGQRFGEMEVWALEAYGAAYTLQEMLTVKSDDVEGRTKMYEALVKGKNTPEPGVPESLNVLIKELQSLALDVSLMTEEEAIRYSEKFDKAKEQEKGGE